jgi:predicted neuraminidase
MGAVWYAGSREGAKDVAIYFAERSTGSGGQWSDPVPVVTRSSASEELRRHVKKVGNPIIFKMSGEDIGLIYVSVSVGGWSGSSLNLKTSRDGGRTWSPSVRLTLSPFLNVSELVRTKPLPLRGGGLAIPIYQEFLGRFPEILWLFSDARDGCLMVGKTRMTGGRDFIQPAVVPFDAKSAAVFYRDMSPRRSVVMAETSDAGLTWSSPRAIDLPNPNAGIHALPLSSGSILMAFNDSKRHRENLKLAVSKDGGQSWTRIATLEDTPGEEFSYPTMDRDADGRIHLVYTWRRNRIKHAVFNEAWIEGQLKGISW